MKNVLLVISGIILLISSCKKDDDDNNDPSAINKENLSGSYTLVTATGKIAGVEIDLTNYPAVLPACQKDDILTLNPDYTYVSTDAGTKCNPDGSESGTWSLPNDSTIIIDAQTFSIQSFDGSNLKVGYKETVPVYGQVEIAATFKKQ